MENLKKLLLGIIIIAEEILSRKIEMKKKFNNRNPIKFENKKDWRC